MAKILPNPTPSTIVPLGTPQRVLAVAQPTDPPRSIRRAAARPAGPRGNAPNRRLLEAARAGIVTRSNTTPGTQGRQAADRAVYERRQRHAEARGLTARQAAGHPATGDVLPTISAIVRDPDGYTQLREMEVSPGRVEIRAATTTWCGSSLRGESPRPSSSAVCPAGARSPVGRSWSPAPRPCSPP